MSRALYAVPMPREGSPKYQQIADDLRARMVAGEFPPDSRLPSKSEMMRDYSTALTTVNNAIAVLRQEGLAETIQGVGTFARKAPDPGPSQYDMVMARLDELDDRVRQLERTRAAEREQQP